MRRILHCACLVVLLAATCGCTSVRLRLPPDEGAAEKQTFVYRGTRADAAMLGPSAVLFGNGVAHPAKAQSWVFVTLLPYHVLDLPFSFTLDTLCLPWDGVVASRCEDSDDDDGDLLWDDSIPQ